MNCPGCGTRIPTTYRGRPIKQALPCAGCICLSCWRVKVVGSDYCLPCVDRRAAELRHPGLELGCIMCGRVGPYDAHDLSPKCLTCGGSLLLLVA